MKRTFYHLTLSFLIFLSPSFAKLSEKEVPKEIKDVLSRLEKSCRHQETY